MERLVSGVRWWARLSALVALACVVGAALMPSLASAAEPGVVVTLRGPNAEVIAWVRERRVEVAIDGHPPRAFADARITVTRQRIQIVARDRDHTVVAWSNRPLTNGRISMLVHDPHRRARASTIGGYPTELEVTGERPPRVVTAGLRR